jgi:hypothetical protein
MPKLWAATVDGWGERPWRTVEVMICRLFPPYGCLAITRDAMTGHILVEGEQWV